MRDLYEAWGLYFLFRVFLQSREDVVGLAIMLAVVLTPLAAAMLFESFTGNNLFAQFGGVSNLAAVREGVVRAQGPFPPVLAGSVGGASMALMTCLWRSHRATAVLGLAACAAIVVASGSSGPILAAGSGMGVICLWQLREARRLMRWSAVAVYLMLGLMMNRPPALHYHAH